ncbi:MAG: hypothetical protein ACYTFY_04420 [Planctomycetota bacterium]|jgi:hypothetical protein
MSSQGDLQNWLNQLKKRQGGGGAQPSQQRPAAPRQASQSQDYQARAPEKRRVQSFDPDLVEVETSSSGMSATDIALQNMKKQEEQERIAKKREALARKQRAEKRLAREKKQAEEAGKKKSRKTVRKKRKQDPAVVKTAKPVCEDIVDIVGIHYKLRNNAAAMKEALILSEIIMPPIAMREKRQFF